MARPLRIGLREANQRFSKAIKAVKAGKDVILTDRGKPIAVIKALTRAPGLEQVVRELEAAGVLQAATRRGPMPPWRPRRLRGSPLAQTVEEERETR
jgi:antitoxin (DNA-binding transcriptional repressor) of toxin-antitoxin stability system